MAVRYLNVGRHKFPFPSSDCPFAYFLEPANLLTIFVYYSGIHNWTMQTFVRGEGS